MQLRIIDALGPFFVDKPDRETVNWSKVIFSDLETDGRLAGDIIDNIIVNFETYASKVSNLGYDSISIDDLAHLVVLPFYNPQLQVLLEDYGSLYDRLFCIAKKHRLKVFVNTDYLFFNEDISRYLEENTIAPDDFFVDVLKRAMERYPDIQGVIVRIGEKDGNDVTGTFLSQLQLETPRQANQLIKKILPVFERRNKTLIFRTWTIGAYKIGDLIWNKKTYDAVFSSIQSDALVIGMKYGDTDFMRYLTLNPLFADSQHKLIIELQTRREWEGMGTYPSFVGWDYARYLAELSANKNLVGIHVWCQTGGWAKREWTNLTYLHGSSFWNELNTEVVIDMVHHGLSVEDAIARFCNRRNIGGAPQFTRLLEYSDIAIKKGFYISDIAVKELYFRRTRIPPLMWLTWDRIHLPSLFVYVHRMLLPHKNNVLKDGLEAVEAVEKAISLAKELNLDDREVTSLFFERDTLEILAQLRRYIFQAQSKKTLIKINQQITEYQKKYPQHYSIQYLVPIKKRHLPRSLLRLFVRATLSYRMLDRLLLWFSPLQARLIGYYLKKSKSHLADQSMGFDTLFK